jgi:hypothetical protein
MGNKGGQTTTTESEPWAGQSPFLEDLFAQGQNLYNQGPQQYYPGQTVAPFSPESMMGMDMMTQRAIGGSPQQDMFGQYLMNTMGQQNMDPNVMFGYGNQAAQGIGAGQQTVNQGLGGMQTGQNMMHQAGQAGMGMGQPNQMVGGAANALSGMTGYGGLGEAQQFAGNPALGALPASQQYAMSQMGVGGAGNQQLAQTAGGGFLGSNPYLDQMFDVASGRAGEAFNEQTMPGIAAQFGSAGRTGGGIHQQVAGNAARQFGRDLQGMASDIYAPAYESERDRMINAAQGASGAGLGAAGLGVDTFGQYNQADLGRRGLASSQYLGERGLGQQGAGMWGDLGLGQGNLALGGYGLAGQMGQGYAGAGNQMGNIGLGQQQIGLAGMGGMQDMYGQIGQDQFRAGTLMPSYNDMQYGDIERLLGVGGMREDQTQRYMGANQDRWNFGQAAPWQNLNNYANVIYGLPGGYGTQSMTQPGGSRASGAMGGAMAGSSMGPWGALAGGLLGAFS